MRRKAALLRVMDYHRGSRTRLTVRWDQDPMAATSMGREKDAVLGKENTRLDAISH
jgi:hypothetical protein